MADGSGAREGDWATPEKLQEILDVSPFQRWLGLELADTREGDDIAIALDLREDFVSNPRVKAVHGGILATLIDLTGLYAILATNTAATATVDLRVDYHRVANEGRIIARGRTIRLGKTVSCAETSIFDADDRLIASGRGTYLTDQS